MAGTKENFQAMSVCFILLCICHTCFSYGYRNSIFSPQIFSTIIDTPAPPFASQNLAPLNKNDYINNQYVSRIPSTTQRPAPVSVSEEQREFFDLTYPFDNDTIFYPGQRFDRFHVLRDIESNTNRTPSNYQFSYNTFSLCFSEHGGTHIDAPFHFNRYGWRVGEIPLDSLVDVPTALIDVEQHVFALKNPEQFELQVDHILEHEAKHGRIPQGALILVHYGWGKFYPDRMRYAGWDNSTSGLGGANFTFQFPVISPNAASWLLRERAIIGLGFDTMSPDIGTPYVHIILLENQIYVIENVANLDNVVRSTRRQRNRPCDLRSFVLPIKYMGTGGPVRLVSYCSV